jgi:hypothetical protein
VQGAAVQPADDEGSIGGERVVDVTCQRPERPYPDGEPRGWEILTLHRKDPAHGGGNIGRSGAGEELRGEAVHGHVPQH